MTMTMKLILALATLAGAAATQNYTNSPLSLGAAEGNSNNTFPWNFASGRYQQIHGDLRGVPRIITALSFRRDGTFAALASSTARTVDAELFMGNSDFALASTTFASNYTSAPLQVVNRKQINLPDFTANQGNPAPWALIIPFDTPFTSAGVIDVTWEYVVYSNTATGTYIGDFHSFVTTAAGAQVNTGTTTGCLATGRTARMTITGPQSTNFLTQTMSIGWSCANGATSAPSAILVGLVNPNVAVPGLCANLFVDQVFLSVSLTSSATGAFSVPTISIPYDPLLVGFQVNAQGASLDAGQAGIPVAVSSGVNTTFAAMPPAPADKVARMYFSGSATNPTGSLGLYGILDTRFTH